MKLMPLLGLSPPPPPSKWNSATQDIIRQSSIPARALHINTQYFVVDDLYLHILDQLCIWIVDTRRSQWARLMMANENTLFMMLVGCATRFEACWSQFLAKFNRFVTLITHFGTYSARFRNIKICVHNNDDKTDYFTPCVCVYYLGLSIVYLDWQWQPLPKALRKSYLACNRMV